MSPSAPARPDPIDDPIDVGPLLDRDPDPAARSRRAAVGRRIGAACRDVGFFTVTGHGVEPELRRSLQRVAEAFFTLDDSEKQRVAMPRAGRAWRGWFPVGGELTSGRPDDKEGLYFGTDLPTAHPAVRAGRLLHGPNLYPSRPPELRAVVDEWMARVTEVGRAVLRGMALGLDLDEDWFDRWCAEPTVLFRMFHYPPRPPGLPAEWGVGEHTDYGLLTLLAQDDVGGLEVRVGEEWVAVPADPDVLVCNLGDMLERATGGRYRSTAHRVGLPDRDRYSFPLFLDPGWDVVVEPVPGLEPDEELRRRSRAGRWDGADLLAPGARTYGEHLTAKVRAVFPDLAGAVEED